VTLAEPAALPTGAAVLLTADGAVTRGGWMRAAQSSGVPLLIVRAGPDAERLYALLGGHTAMRRRLAEDSAAHPRPNVVALPAALFAKFAASAGREVVLELPPVVEDHTTTVNAVGFLPGTDPDAGLLLFSAHLDHLGRRADGTIMHGANDDASGVTAVLELAHALAAGPRLRRGILFVCYGSEEIGGFGSTYFAAHPPVPLQRIAANLEFEMIGVADPTLRANTLMMTGYERSNLGAALAAHGFAVTADPYPEQHFFERSDNYPLALAGVVAHTLAGGGEVPTYHQPSDTIASLDYTLLVTAIQSLVEPARWLADGDFVPSWNPGGKPER
jgi:Zn-dependent M28 family amino/carboxypeptidase